VKRLAPQREEFVEAVRSLVNNGEDETAAELAANIWRVWLISGDIAGGRQLLTAALDVGRQQPSGARALALYGDELLAFRAGAMADPQARNQQTLEEARAIEDPRAEALALVGLSRVAFRNANYPRVRALASQAREIARDLDPDARLAPLHMLAAATRLDGDYDHAVELYAEEPGIKPKPGRHARGCHGAAQHWPRRDPPWQSRPGGAPLRRVHHHPQPR
jgi:hypothetical protein